MTTVVGGVCGTSSVCIAGDVGAACTQDGQCTQTLGLDTTQLSIGRGRTDIAHLTQAGAIDIPVICLGGSNALTPVPVEYLPFAESLAPCAVPSCDGTPRVVDPSLPNPSFPTFGEAAGGFEVHIIEGLAHQDIIGSEVGPGSDVMGPVADFIARNVQ